MLEIPLKRYGRIDEERLVVISVVDEVVAELYLATEADVLSDIIPELRFGEDDEHAVTLMTWAPVLTAPEIDEAREGTLVMGEVQAPHTRELETTVGIGVFIALEVLLVHQLY